MSTTTGTQADLFHEQTSPFDLLVGHGTTLQVLGRLKAEGIRVRVMTTTRTGYRLQGVAPAGLIERLNLPALQTPSKATRGPRSKSQTRHH